MKKCLLGLMLIFSGFFGYSQSNSLGINAGFGHAWITNNGDNQYKPHGNFGISYVHSTKTNFGFGADLKYSIEGGKGETQVVGTTVSSETTLQYIRLPLKAIYFFGNYGNRLRPKIHAGPSLGFLVNAKDKVRNETTDVVLYDAETDDNYNNFDIGILAGAGLNYRLVRNTWFTADLNYYNGFRDIRAENSGDSPRRSNNHLALNLGVNWGIGK